jgi:hypothetical protein
MTPEFSTGQTVRVARREPAGHVRTPRYLNGRLGRILSVSGAYPDPANLAESGLGLPYRMLYRVIFDMTDVWDDYRGEPADELVADIYDNWLEPVEKSDA